MQKITTSVFIILWRAYCSGPMVDDYDRSYQSWVRQFDAGTTRDIGQRCRRPIQKATRTTRTSGGRTRFDLPSHRPTHRHFCTISLYSTPTHRIASPPPAPPNSCGYAGCFCFLYRTTSTVCRHIGVLLFRPKPDQRRPPENGRNLQTGNRRGAPEAKRASRNRPGSIPLADRLATKFSLDDGFHRTIEWFAVNFQI